MLLTEGGLRDLNVRELRSWDIGTTMLKVDYSVAGFKSVLDLKVILEFEEDNEQIRSHILLTFKELMMLLI